ncbi:hypothetical protein NCG89_04640 [Spongiibacter taiwanensis]|uniref:hypothetical protein n=1 Tax=Spongiibacter taiwanensis TaxID=1748242 RepID=UPI0020365A86|nr:hypothetical protein [Spongiibacter taiwanensis]USA44071.1 hypothetical protein NCG89_04640 [Spongiibacter taiwanensis]
MTLHPQSSVSLWLAMQANPVFLSFLRGICRPLFLQQLPRVISQWCVTVVVQVGASFAGIKIIITPLRGLAVIRCAALVRFVGVACAAPVHQGVFRFPK